MLVFCLPAFSECRAAAGSCLPRRGGRIFEFRIRIAYEHAARSIDAIGRLLSGWLRKQSGQNHKAERRRRLPCRRLNVGMGHKGGAWGLMEQR